ncbi:MAG: hypothetical protein IKU71_06255, partial [Kiritimatiellae bacterium]|nr:hypothetical protein [Kiritimatiellia bacterium]
MNKTTKILATTIACLALAGTCLADTKTTYRDAQGRLQGTKTTATSGKTTYRDAQGRLQGTTTTDSSGKTTWRDSMGRLQ